MESKITITLGEGGHFALSWAGRMISSTLITPVWDRIQETLAAKQQVLRTLDVASGPSHEHSFAVLAECS